METRDKGLIHDPGRMKWDRMRFRDAVKNGMQFKPYELYISGIFHLIFQTEADSVAGN